MPPVGSLGGRLVSGVEQQAHRAINPHAGPHDGSLEDQGGQAGSRPPLPVDRSRPLCHQGSQLGLSDPPGGPNQTTQSDLAPPEPTLGLRGEGLVPAECAT
jgi:hypothetical protein